MDAYKVPLLYVLIISVIHPFFFSFMHFFYFSELDHLQNHDAFFKNQMLWFLLGINFLFCGFSGIKKLILIFLDLKTYFYALRMTLFWGLILSAFIYFDLFSIDSLTTFDGIDELLFQWFPFFFLHFMLLLTEQLLLIRWTKSMLTPHAAIFIAVFSFVAKIQWLNPSLSYTLFLLLVFFLGKSCNDQARFGFVFSFFVIFQAIFGIFFFTTTFPSIWILRNASFSFPLSYGLNLVLFLLLIKEVFWIRFRLYDKIDS